MKLLFNLVLVIASVKAFAHGEDKLGPNGGYLKMPGTFHTEVVPTKDGKFSIYLLDINFKNATIKDSKVTASINNGTKKNFNCIAKRNHFVCDSKKDDLTKGTLTILAERNSIKGTEAVYSLPLKLSESGTEMKGDDHGSHH